jgi:hypothetical protein
MRFDTPDALRDPGLIAATAFGVEVQVARYSLAGLSYVLRSNYDSESREIRETSARAGFSASVGSVVVTPYLQNGESVN